MISSNGHGSLPAHVHCADAVAPSAQMQACETSLQVIWRAGEAAVPAELPASAAMAESLLAHAVPVLQLCLRLHPLDAARALRAVPKLAPLSGWALPASRSGALESAEGDRRADPIPGPVASQQAAIAVCLLQGVWDPAGSRVPKAGLEGSNVQGLPSPVRLSVDPGDPACVEALARVAGACMATLSAAYRQPFLNAEASSCVQGRWVVYHCLLLAAL